MRTLFFLPIILISQVEAMNFLKISTIKELAVIARTFKQEGYSRLWWVTDIDGMLVNIKNDYRLVEGDLTRKIFKWLDIMAAHKVGLTKFNSRNAFQLAAALRAKQIVFSKEVEADENEFLIVPHSKVDVLSYGIVYAGNPKGTALVHYIEYMKYTKEAPDMVIFSDDSQDNVDNVLSEMSISYPKIKVTGVLYNPVK